MNGWSEALRQELQPDIRVTVIEPGAVATELTDHITDPAAKQGAQQLYAQLAITPRRRRGGHRLRRHPTPPNDTERDPPPTHRANRLTSPVRRWRSDPP
jgi:NAD(P)-dependent dehydrogenase (short-subunit alcohol dehydrogenase family)